MEKEGLVKKRQEVKESSLERIGDPDLANQISFRT